jgi:hypothetical protein
MVRQQPLLAEERLIRWGLVFLLQKALSKGSSFPHAVTRSCVGADRVAIRSPGASVLPIRRYIDVCAHRISLSPEQRRQS